MGETTQSTLFLPGVNYYEQHNYVSNSTLNAFKDWLSTTRKRDLTAAYAFGNLQDALMTEKKLVNFNENSVILADGAKAFFTSAQMQQAIDMQNAAYNDPVVHMIFKNMDFQHERYVDSFEIVHSGRVFYLPFRIKMDGNAKRIRTGMDLKTTACTTQRSFVDSLYQFRYDQQNAVYMDVEELDRFWFVGVGKNKLRNGTYPVFKHCVKRGDEFYTGGKKRYEYWASLYEAMIYNLDASLIN